MRALKSVFFHCLHFVYMRFFAVLTTSLCSNVTKKGFIWTNNELFCSYVLRNDRRFIFYIAVFVKWLWAMPMITLNFHTRCLNDRKYKYELSDTQYQIACKRWSASNDGRNHYEFWHTKRVKGKDGRTDIWIGVSRSAAIKQLNQLKAKERGNMISSNNPQLRYQKKVELWIW